MTNSQAQFLKMTETPIPNLVSRLAVPTIISMLVSSIYNMADTFFVAKLGTSAAGAVGIVFSLMAVLSQTMGLTGIQITQPVANVLTAICTVPFMILFFKEIKQ